jgi:lipoprotein signal peptidase
MTADLNSQPAAENQQSLPPLRSPAALSRFLLVTLVGLAADLWTKVWAFKALADDQTTIAGQVRVDSRTYEFIPGWLHFRCTANEGAVFGIGQGNRWLFVVVSVLAIVFLTYLFATSGRQRFYQVVLGMLLAGVLGNMYDRIFHGFVRDMIYIFPGQYWPTWITARVPNWPWARGELFPWIFNVADTLLCAGVGLMLAYSLFASHHPDRDAHDRPAELSTTES